MAIYQPLMGNPFVDAGVSAICEYLKKEAGEITRKDLIEMIDTFAPVICTPAWIKNLFSIFPNSAATNPANKRKNIVELLKSNWINHFSDIEEIGETGDCTGCGRRSANRYLTKTDVPLTGSGELRNFFPLFGSGIGYCSACALAIQFAPLALVAVSGKFLMVHTNCWKWQRVWARECIRDTSIQISLKQFTGCHNLGYANPRNGLFAVIQDLMSRYETRWSAENATMQIYCFTNYNQGPELDIFLIPASVFRFLAYVYERQFQSAWKEIVRSGYQKVKWDKIQTEDEYKNHINLVYERLLEGKSILGFFLNRQERQVRGDWNLVTLYLKEVHKMSESRLETLKRVGDAIADSIKQLGNVRRLGQLERATRYYEFRNVLLRIIRDRIAQGQSNPLFSLDEYMNDLFPETSGEFMDWRETKDLILFRVYENLHDWLLGQELPEVVEESDKETEE